MKKIIFITFLIITAILITPIRILLLYLEALDSGMITEFNTVYTRDFNVKTWQEKVSFGMSQKEIRGLLGEPFRIDKNTRCDFYSHSKIGLLNFNEYKVCFDGNKIFFLKFKFKYQESKIFGDQIQT